MTATLKPGTRCLCLGRVSTKGQAGPDKVSLGQQAEATRAFALALGQEHGFSGGAVELREDPGVSGLDPARLEEIVVACEGARRPKSAPGFVVVFDMSRFTRLGTQPAMYYLERLSRAGWTLRDTTLKLQGTIGAEMSDAIQITVACEVAAELIRGFRRKVFPAMAKHADRGTWNGGKPPLGYRVEDKRLVRGDDGAIKKVRAAFKAYVDGATLESVGRIVGLGPSGARALLANPAYVGDLAWGRRNGSEYRGGKEGAHAAIVTRELWERVQDRLRSPNPRYAHGAKRTAPKGALPYVLSKVARCACRADQFLVGGGGIPAKATEEQRLRWRGYQCKACRGRVGQAALEAAVYGAIAKAIREADESGDLKKRMDKWVAARIAASSVAGVERERADLLKRKARLIRTAEETDDRDVSARIREVNARLRELDIAAKAQPDPRAVKAEGQRILAETRAAVAQRTVTPEAANVSLSRLRPLITGVTWDRETRQVEVTLTPWHGTEVGIVPSPRPHSGSNGPWRVRA